MATIKRWYYLVLEWWLSLQAEIGVGLIAQVQSDLDHHCAKLNTVIRMRESVRRKLMATDRL